MLRASLLAAAAMLLSGQALAWDQALCAPGTGTTTAATVVSTDEPFYWCFTGGSGTSPTVRLDPTGKASGLVIAATCIGGACEFKAQRCDEPDCGNPIDVEFIDGNGTLTSSIEGTPVRPEVPIWHGRWWYRVVVASGAGRAAVAPLGGGGG